MCLRTKILLGSSVVFIVAGIIVSSVWRFPKAPAASVILPVGAILFGLFLTSRLLEKESSAYDAEKHAADAAAERRRS